MNRGARRGAAVAVGALLAASCSAGGRDDAPPAAVAAFRQQDRGVTLTVVGSVAAVLGAHLFEVGTVGGRTVVLDPAAAPVHLGRNVEVTGTLRTTPVADLEAEYGIRIDPGAAAAVAGHPLLVAASVAVL